MTTVSASRPALAQRLKRVQVAATVAMTVKARELRAQGIDVIQLTIGEPDFDTPLHAIEAAHQAALSGQTKYPPQDGTPELKAAVQRKFKRDRGLDYALDDKSQKKIAREMLKMVTDINGKYLTGAGITMDARNSVSCETCHHGLSKPKTLRNALGGAIDAKGADSAVALYRELRTRYYGAAAYDFSENSLVNAANDANRANNRPAALALLKLNLEFYDKSAATYQSMANIHLAGNDTASAIDALKKAVALQPNNQQLQGMLTRLGAKPPLGR